MEAHRSPHIKSSPDDFIVEEIPAYEPSGSGEHLFVRFTKRNLTTDEAVHVIARALGSNPRDVGVAGLKDKVAVTTQTISVTMPRALGERDAFVERARALTLGDIQIHAATPHTNKLKTGHLLGNRFKIYVRGVHREKLPAIEASIDRVRREGLPNAFGAQRFGRDADNAEKAKRWLRDEIPLPRSPRDKRFLWSALQSAMFNAVLDARVNDGSWATPLEGDLLKKRDSGGLFLCEDPATDRARALTGEVSPTGPMFGASMREPSGKPAELEGAVLAKWLGDRSVLERTKSLGEGTRRPLRLWVEEMRVELDFGNWDSEYAQRFRLGGQGPRTPARNEELGIWFYFVLPKGAYATTVLSSVLAENTLLPAPEERKPND